MFKIAHIINPVYAPKTSDLYIAQPITFQTMRTAKNVAREVGVCVDQFAVSYPETQNMLPEDFLPAPCLERSVLDVMENRPLSPGLKLPLIGDILERLYAVSDADYFIYTNVDIALRPDFYIEVHRLINKGYDAFIINRRTISARYTAIEQIPAMYHEDGEKHPGQDCFIFKREAFPKYVLNSACIGTMGIGKIMAMNMIAHAQQFKLFTDLRLTFHIGEERAWARPEMIEYRRHNIREAFKVLNFYHKTGKRFSHPIILNFISRFQPQKRKPLC